MLLARSILLLLVAAGVESATECSEECEAKFLTGCVDYRCENGEDGPTLCADELDAGTGPLAAVCETGCYMTENMELSTCPQEGLAAGGGGGDVCSSKCEAQFDSCRRLNYGKGLDGALQCAKELTEFAGPLATICTKGCRMTEGMAAAAQMCSAECEEKFLRRCLPHHCKGGKDGHRKCTDELQEHKGPLTKVCVQGCFLTPEMAAAKCEWQEGLSVEDAALLSDDGDDEGEDEALKRYTQFAESTASQNYCGEACEALFIGGCMAHHCKTASVGMGSGVCTKELVEFTGPLAEAGRCEKGCAPTEKMLTATCKKEEPTQNQHKEDPVEEGDTSLFDGPCDADCEQLFYDGCLAHHCAKVLDGAAVCRAEVEGRVGQLFKVCKKGCTLTPKMAAYTCESVEGALATAPDNQCSVECSRQFVEECLPAYCEKGENGPAHCKAELVDMRGPLAEVCEAGCRWTNEMLSSDSCGKVAAASSGTRKDHPNDGQQPPPLQKDGMCSEECEDKYIRNCRVHYCKAGQGYEGVATCTAEFEKRAGPFKAVCAKGCQRTVAMDASDSKECCSEECERAFVDTCMPFSCDLHPAAKGNELNALALLECSEQIHTDTGALATSCESGCHMTENMGRTTCERAPKDEVSGEHGAPVPPELRERAERMAGFADCDVCITNGGAWCTDSNKCVADAEGLCKSKQSHVGCNSQFGVGRCPGKEHLHEELCETAAKNTVLRDRPDEL